MREFLMGKITFYDSNKKCQEIRYRDVACETKYIAYVFLLIYDFATSLLINSN